ncbi:MAG: VWA domain-containing protein [Pseudobdellovibrionaceae bacterium]
MFRFAEPTYLYGLLLVLGLYLMYFVLQKRANKKILQVLGPHVYPILAQSLSLSKRKRKWHLQMLVIVLMIISLARPQVAGSKETIRSEGVEIILAVDVSESMLADDVKPSRLELAKIDLARLVDRMPGHRFGLVAFAGSAGLSSPLTNDPAAIKMYIESLTTDSVSTQGTNFEQAIKTSMQAFQRGGVESDDAVKVTKVILLTSDGEDHEPNALTEAQKAASQSIRIFSLAYGTQKGAPIPVRDGFGYLKGYKKDRKGQTILTTVNGEELKKIAESGQGSFLFASPGSDYILSLQNKIDQLEKTQFESKTAVSYAEKFQIPLLLAFLLGALELILGERRALPRFWKGRFEVPEV